jgi:Zn-dependent M28 family amino/carboxypeptidase
MLSFRVEHLIPNMMRTPSVLILLGSLAATAPAVAQTPAPRPITEHEIDGHLRFLSSDLLEGRAPATRGGKLTAEYLAAQLRSFGVEPGVGGSYFQRVPIDVVAMSPRTLAVKAEGKASNPLRYPEDVVVWAGSATERSSGSGELVFVGYGATAPEYRWDDFKDVDVRGKVLVILVNDPPAPADEPELFGGRAMTYYGRWTYKFEEAERRGAAGALIVHTTEQAGYPWHTVVGSWAKEQRMLPRDPRRPAPLGFQGWITDSAATALFAAAGADLAALRRAAESRDFRPVATGIDLTVTFDNSVANLESENVVGIVRGRGQGAARANQFVTVSAHWDHLGIGPPVNGDSIYNGARDNAAGVATILAVARAAAQRPPTGRSLMFVLVTAEESGLLGAHYFARNTPVPQERIIANVNVDPGAVYGRTRDLRVLGDNKSSLGPSLRRMIQPMGLTITPDAHPERGYFYRSDHFAFALVGIPAVSIGEGATYVNARGAERIAEYDAKHYHQPSDEYREDFDLSGAVQIANVVHSFVRQLAASAAAPTWNADAEFRDSRPPGSARE